MADGGTESINNADDIANCPVNESNVPGRRISMAKHMEFKGKLESWIDTMNEKQFVRFSDFVGESIEIVNAFIYVGKDGTKTAGKEGFTALFKDSEDNTWYSTSFGSVIVKQGKEIIAELDKGSDGVIVDVRKKVSKTSGSEYVYFA